MARGTNINDQTDLEELKDKIEALLKEYNAYIDYIDGLDDTVLIDKDTNEMLTI